MSTFIEKLKVNWDEGKFVCVGLDSDMDSPKFPENVPNHPWAAKHDWLSKEQVKQLSFNCHIIDLTHNLVCTYKPNLAFYKGALGKEVLKLTIEYIHIVASDVPVILDAKQGDIDNTNNGYVSDDFEYYLADAVTVNPYLGMVAMKSFLDQTNKGIIVLCHTSNEGADEIQDVVCDVLLHRPSGEVFSTLIQARLEGQKEGPFDFVKMPLYQFVAHRVAQKWNRNGNCLVVVGATYADNELAPVRQIIGNMPILLPGIGKQGGDLESTVLHGQTEDGQGMIINSSRDIIFASQGQDFAEAARRKTQELNDAINLCRQAARI